MWKALSVAIISAAVVCIFCIWANYFIESNKIEAKNQLEHERIELEKETIRPRKIWEKE